MVWKEDITSVTREPILGNLDGMHSIGMLVEFLEAKKLRLKLDVNILKVQRGFEFCTPGSRFTKLYYQQFSLLA